MRDAGTMVGNGDRDPIGLPANGDVDTTIVVGVLHRILDEISERRDEFATLGHHVQRTFGCLHVDVHTS